MPGLRREEVALLAGLSVDYYTKLERGNLTGASEGVLDSIARALQLDEAERLHLFDLARSSHRVTRSPRRTGPSRVRPTVQRLLDAMTGVPAYVRNGRLDILAANTLGAAVYSPIVAGQRLPVNTARFAFLVGSACACLGRELRTVGSPHHSAAWPAGVSHDRGARSSAGSHS